ncbi:Uncharacterised protein [BD1-7 clade bacterium]|uniref:TRAP transporter small permease protein n=1 Tax=BD1-7 clade bacterium TaxID=2029982 RepID=A0A5S9MX80_9GAMM|nr:Uncharacterised protein [BD1-7 clade bacterium]CAA0083007.1 Uncharacterised protein [BD1-7 clade bacterium]
MPLIHFFDAMIDRIGRAASWLVFAMMLLTCLVVFLRYGFNIGSIALQESVIYLHATVFLLGLSYTLQADEHVRVDIFYQHFTDQHKAWVNAVGCIVFLIPFCLFVIVVSWPFFINALVIRESSPEPGGLPLVFVLKGMIPLGMSLLLIQSVSLLCRSALTLVLPGEDD